MSNYNEKCDVWSMGVVLYILLSGMVPFPGDSHKEIIENVLSGEYHYNYEPFKYISEQAKDLISKLLIKNVDKRLSADKAYNHPWVANSQDRSDEPIAGDAYINMLNFMYAVKLKKTTLTYLASKLPEKYVEDLRAAFI
jgi:calcium-dependent protein kinase